MKISLNWLSDFVAWAEKDPHAIADRLTLGTAEVEEVDMQGALLRDCCVGEIVDVKKHPDADRLSIATVQTDKGGKTVVCGGTNVKQGMKVAFAHIGATVKWHGGELMTLEPVKIRGIASEGMICAAEELGLEAMYQPEKEDGERPIMDLGRMEAGGRRLEAGQSLRIALTLTDTILHINNTAITTRPDLFSHIGFARECVALGLATWKKKPAFKLPKAPSKKPSVTMKMDNPELVPRYLSCEMTIDDIGETPDWMRAKLEAIGVRCVNLPVDITNYVSAEIGVPLHSFDATDISGDVHLRLSKKGEKITTLDEVERVLPEGALVLSDDLGIFDLLGIMGGLRSSTKPTTRHIYVHAASLDPAAIRRGIIGTGHRTDASTVYEKGVQPVTTEQGFIRALELFLELIPGAKITSSIENKGDNGKAPDIKISIEEIQGTLGMDIGEKEIVNILESLEFTVTKEKVAKKTQFTTHYPLLTVSPPLRRLRDITGSHDIVEEIGRIYGFEHVPSVLPNAPLQLPKRDQRIHTMRNALSMQGFWELTPLSLVSPSMLERCKLPVAEAVALQNPLGEETSLLQTSTLPRLLIHAEKYLPQSDSDLQTFQWGNVFSSNKPEHSELGGLLVARQETGLNNDPFLRLKTYALHALKSAGFAAEVQEAKHVPPYAHSGRVADIAVHGKIVGTICELHPSIRKQFDLPHRAASFMLNASMLLAMPVAIKHAQPIPQFPAITYDVTILRTQKDALADLLKTVRGSHELLENVAVQDIYAGKPLTDGQYNLTLRFTYRSAERTLTEEEVKKAHEKVCELLASRN